MPADLGSLFRSMEKSRARLNNALDKVAPQAEIYPSWKIKQVMDHIAGWDELVVSSLAAYRDGKAPPKMTDTRIDQYNAASISARNGLSVDESRQAYELEREKVLEMLQSLPPEMFDKEYPASWGGTCTITGIMKIFISHELEHARQIEKVLANLDQST
jgi:hypothetical protein